jgi:hypothetical protein
MALLPQGAVFGVKTAARAHGWPPTPGCTLYTAKNKNVPLKWKRCCSLVASKYVITKVSNFRPGKPGEPTSEDGQIYTFQTHRETTANHQRQERI